MASVERRPALFRAEGIIHTPTAGAGNETDELIEASHVELGDDWPGVVRRESKPQGTGPCQTAGECHAIRGIQFLAAHRVRPRLRHRLSIIELQVHGVAVRLLLDACRGADGDEHLGRAREAANDEQGLALMRHFGMPFRT